MPAKPRNVGDMCMRKNGVRKLLLSLGCAAALMAGSASADLAVVSSQSDFIRLITGKTLSRPLIKIEVSEGGSISGKGARWAVTGDWMWRDGFFCRSLYWGGSELGYNCQEVRASEGRVRFTSDRGTGDSADFKLN
jgi:hypothetical protein